MSAFWSGTVGAFLGEDPDALVARLAHAQMARFATTQAAQLRAWADSIALLRAVLTRVAAQRDWRVLLEYGLLRLGRRIDVVLVTDRAVFVFEFKIGATGFDSAAREQVEDYALDLQDFHAASRHHPIVPILVASAARPPPAPWPLLLAGVSAVQCASADSLPGLLAGLIERLPPPRVPLDPLSWERAPYRPVPTIVEAAQMLYARHGVEEIAAARADVPNLTRTRDAIGRAIALARAERRHVAAFVTGIPGAGKTLCGLNAAFGGEGDRQATFLTGNPTLVHVLREALARDAAGGQRGMLRAARQRVESAIQALPLFRDHHVATGDCPAERVAVVDEAQRCWSRDWAVAKTRDRRVQLTDSEPGHLLDIMGRHGDWAALICLVGNGQEIHTGEGGLAEWGAALTARPRWQVFASPLVLAATDARQRLPALPGLQVVEDLHLAVPVRAIRSARACEWVDAVLAGEADRAALIAREAGGVPFALTRDLPAMREALRHDCRGTRRAGLLASSGAARLRAEGLGVAVPHMDAGAVARWFLDRWPDVRASDALETVATEFSCQGLELDHAGLCWGGDLVLAPGRSGWAARDFRGTAWTWLRAPEPVSNRLNTYRVLLTRARYRTIIWVPRGDAADATRPPAELDRIAAFLAECGVPALAPALPQPIAAPVLL